MRPVTVRQDVAAPIDEVWALLTDWSAHGRWIPLTAVRPITGPAGPIGVGSGLVARTGVGPLAFEDPMTVQRWQPPTRGRCGLFEIAKTGTVVAGGASVVVQPTGPNSCRVEWTELAEPVPLRRVPFADRVAALATRMLFARVLRQLGAEAEAASADEGTDAGADEASR